MPIAGQGGNIRSRVVAAVDRAFAERIKLAFLRKGIVDPDRSSTEITAVLRVGGGKETSATGGGSDWRTRLVAGRAELHIDRASYSGPRFVQGDKIQALDRHREPWFEVLRIDDRGDNRLVLELGEV